MVEIYFSTDVESDGPIPFKNSMLSFGSVAFSPEGKELGEVGFNLETLPGATPNHGTMEWWKQHPEAWEACRQNLVTPDKAMNEYVAWITSFPGKPVFVGYPATYDFLFIYCYLIQFTGSSPFGFQGLDLKSYAMAKLGTEFKETTKRNMPRSWFDKKYPHTHKAIDDAREQGHLFFSMRNHGK
jgi:hypothetical protein